MQAQRQARRGPKLKQLHWVKLNTPQQGTIWQRVDVSQARLNFAQLEADFQVRLPSVCLPLLVTYLLL